MTSIKTKSQLGDALSVAIIGVIIGVAIVKGIKELGEQHDTSPELPSNKVDWVAIGRSILSEKSLPDQTLSEYLQRQYLGLYLIGRSGKQLSNSEIERVSKHLIHFHQQLNRETDSGIARWYETIGVSHQTLLREELAKCPEILGLGVVPEYIAHALGENIQGLLEFGDFLSDFTDLQNRGLLEKV